MKKVLYAVSFSLYGIYLFLSVFFLVYYKVSEFAYDLILYMTMGLGFLEIIVMLFWVVNKLEIKRLTGGVHISYVVLACAFHYALSYLGHFAEYMGLYLGLFYGLGAVLVTVMTIINYKLKPQKAVYKKQ